MRRKGDEIDSTVRSRAEESHVFYGLFVCLGFPKNQSPENASTASNILNRSGKAIKALELCKEYKHTDCY